MDLEPHPHAELFPLIEGDEFDALVKDIRENGLREPITLLDGKILDGRNRYWAMLEIDNDFGLDAAPKMFVQFDGGDPMEWVISKNLHRRHLSSSQRAMVAYKMATSAPKKNHHTPGVSIGDAAKMLKVSRRTIARARVLAQTDPVAAKAVERGERFIGEEENRRTVSVVMDDAEYERCTAAAEAARLPIATWMRVILLTAVDGASPEIARWGATAEEQHERNEEIRREYRSGVILKDLTKKYGLSLGRLSTIINQEAVTAHQGRR